MGARAWRSTRILLPERAADVVVAIKSELRRSGFLKDCTFCLDLETRKTTDRKQKARLPRGFCAFQIVAVNLPAGAGWSFTRRPAIQERAPLGIHHLMISRGQRTNGQLGERSSATATEADRAATASAAFGVTGLRRLDAFRGARVAFAFLFLRAFVILGRP